VVAAAENLQASECASPDLVTTLPQPDKAEPVVQKYYDKPPIVQMPSIWSLFKVLKIKYSPFIFEIRQPLSPSLRPTRHMFCVYLIYAYSFYFLKYNSYI
jgi:hypothetical protein